MDKPSTISRRGFLRALGVTSTSILVPQLWQPDSPAMGVDPAEPGADKSVYLCFEYSAAHHLMSVSRRSFTDASYREVVWKAAKEEPIVGKHRAELSDFTERPIPKSRFDPMS